MTDLAWRCRASAAAFLLMASSGPTFAAECLLEPQGEGRVATVIDTRSLRLEDGREVRLAGFARRNRQGERQGRVVGHRRRP